MEKKNCVPWLVRSDRCDRCGGYVKPQDDVAAQPEEGFAYLARHKTCPPD